MHARVITAHVRLDAIDEGIEGWKAAQLETTVKQTGFIRNALLVDRQSGKSVITSFWETEHDAIASLQGLQQGWDRMAAQGFLTQRATFEHYEVAATNEAAK